MAPSCEETFVSNCVYIYTAAMYSRRARCTFLIPMIRLAEPYYFGQYVTEIDKILMQQNPPHEFACSPRSIARHLKFWKASEFKNWLLFYSLSFLLDYLPSLYLHHYALLALLQESIDSSLLNAAEIMLNDFIT